MSLSSIPVGNGFVANVLDLVRASFMAPIRVLAQSYEATVGAVSPFGLLFGVAFVFAAVWVLLRYEAASRGGR